MGPLGMAAGLPLLGCVMTPALPISLVLWGLSGLFFCYQVQVVTEFVRTVPDSQRGQAVGIAASGLIAVQGIGVLLGGWVAQSLGVGWAVAGSGIVGMLIALALSIMWSRAEAEADADPSDDVDGSRSRAAHRAEISETTAAPRRVSRGRMVNAGNQHRHRA
jgi:predicted MFS family arabinose efflux permease